MSKMKLACVLAVAFALTLPVAARVKDHEDLEYPPLPDFEIPEPEVFTLDNGMKVFLMEDHELPLVSATARIRSGSHYEPADKVGLADLMATVQRTGGTEDMTGDEMDEYLADRAASVETSMGGDSGFASMNCLAEDFDEVFGVFADVLRRPVFDAEKLDIAKVQVKTGIARRNDNVNAIVGREFSRLIYGPESPMARLEEYATIAAIAREDLVGWHDAYYHPNNVYLGIVGDFDAAEMRKKVRRAFGDWPKGPAFDEPEVPYREQPNPGVFFVEKTDVTQANISTGHLGVQTTNPDYFAVRVMNEVFGGGFASRLFSNIRSEKGLAYSVFGGVGSNFLRKGIFRSGLQTKSSTMAVAVDALREEIARMIESPPSEAEVKRAKESILNSFVFNYDSKGEILQQQMTYDFYGLGTDFLEKFRNNIEKVTPGDVARVAKKYIRPDELTLLVVGKAEDFDRPLDSFGPVTEIDISIPPPPDTTPKVEKTAAGVEKGTRILGETFEALGGASLSGLEGVRVEENLAMSMGPRSVSLGRTTLLVFPDRLRQTTKTPMGDQVVVVTREAGFMSAGGQTRELSSEQIEEAHEQLSRDLLTLLRHHDHPELEAVAAGSDKVGETACEVVAVEFHGVESRLCVASDGRVLKQSFRGKNPLTGTPADVVQLYSDYREVEGVHMPHKVVMQVDGQEILSSTTKAIEVNPEIEEGVFEKPAA